MGALSSQRMAGEIAIKAMDIHRRQLFDLSLKIGRNIHVRDAQLVYHYLTLKTYKYNWIGIILVFIV